MALVWLVSKIQGNKVIIDWHNLGYSILALKLGRDHLFVKIAKWLVLHTTLPRCRDDLMRDSMDDRFESYFGRVAFAHLFVTNAMRDRLVEEWDLQ